MDDVERKAVIESLIFASENPLSIDRIREVFGDVARKEIQRLVSEMVEEYQKFSRGFTIIEVAGGFQFRTRPEYGDWIRKMKKARPPGFSPAAMESLAIIAYRQPVVRMDIEKIRGVDCGGVLRTLLERKLIKIIGKKDVPGKPLVYGTTPKFLETFGLKELSSLPTLKDIESLGSTPPTELLAAMEGASGNKDHTEEGGPPEKGENQQSDATTAENPVGDGNRLPEKG